MTISHESSVPLVVVVGITGKQGGSVARALRDSDKPYRIRGITRDVTKSAAQAFAAEGVEIVGVSLTTDNAGGVLEAFKGANIVFAVTNFNEHCDTAREIAEGKMFVDTAKTVGAKLLVWSALESFTELSNGRFANVPHFDSKAEVTTYAKGSGVPLAVVKAGYYMTNVLEGLQGLKAGPDGRYVFGLPAAGSTLVPLIDVESDFGMYVRAAIESPTLGAGSDIRSGRLISFEEIIAQTAEVSGKKIVYEQISREAFIEAFPVKEMAPQLAEMYQAFEGVGCYGTEKPTSEDILERKLRSWLDILKETPKDKFPA